MKKGLLLAGFFVACLTLCGCSAVTDPAVSSTEKIENVQSVFINRPNDYTILVQQGNQLIPRTITSYNNHHYRHKTFAEVKVFTDTKGPMWVEIRHYKEGGKENTGHLLKIEADIHIHSKNDIQGGQWREKHGKGPEVVGKVNKIE